MTDEITLGEKLGAIYKVATYRPLFTAGVVLFSIATAVLEGVGLGFLLPIIKIAQGSVDQDPSGIMGVFTDLYEFLGIPFTLEYVIVGVGIVITLRYTSTFLVGWLNIYLKNDYMRDIRTRSLSGALDAKISYFDQMGSDDILNTIITQSKYSGDVITKIVKFLRVSLVSLVYLGVAFYIAPYLTLFAIGLLGVASLLVRNFFESGFTVGDRVAVANERIQEAVQGATQGIRDVKLFGMTREMYSNFEDAMDQYVNATVTQKRNSLGINNFHQMVTALSVFILIYLGLEYASLTIGGLGVFLFAMFRLSPRVSTLNSFLFDIEAGLPHLVRSQAFIERIQSQSESSGDKEAPDNIERIEFENVVFSYDNSETVLQDISFGVEKGEFIAFVGQSGAGKSTIVSLLARMYELDSGEIRANGEEIDRFNIESWRSRIAVVRQSPFIFNDTLRYNLTLANRDASQEEIDKVAEIARVDEFLDELPDGYDTLLGDNGVRLSGGQKQRVALARALLKDADVLVLDEATSDLDTNIENQVQSNIESMERDYINITIAHRLSTVKNADRIYTIENGEITDVGTHEELLDKDGKYSELYSA